MSDSLILSQFSAEAHEKLELYYELLLKWSPKINLVSPASLKAARTRHFEDSAQVFASFDGPEPKTWVDMGSGAGFPGMVCCILAAQRGWSTRFVLIESDQRKASFLRAVSRETETDVEILTARIEDCPLQNAQVISARALAPLRRLFPWVMRHGHEECVCLLPKGKSFQEEISEAAESFDFSYEVIPSKLEEKSVILKCWGISHV